ncbi:hypothetical protein GCM10009122_54880 [Fulvivirga kasyanovii]|uniref:Tetratricopeptide repeat protein n=1 Tax=Fulvivirga kasyanovii TaxID=396812 RepID=A0ABW9RN90_9BACT|nr:tetratricopeptide repeat protein [Fulvivirga kasyanovii]MTI25390.1 hypothetical protein [Fulvivirga kasyanovii]
MALNKHILLKKVSFNAYLFLCFIFPVSLLGNGTDWEFNKEEKQAYNYIISLQLDKATPLLSDKRPASAYLKNLSESIRLIITEDPSLFEDYEDAFDDRLDLIEPLETNSGYKNFYLAELYLQRAFVNLKMGYEWTSAWDFRRAYKLIDTNTKKHPDFLPNYKSMGLLHVMIGSVPERHQWLIGLLGMQGSVKQGLSEIEKMAESDHFFSKEAQVVSYLLEAYLLNHGDEAVKDFSVMYANNQKNLLFGYLYMSLLIKNSQSQTALDTYQNLKKLKEGYLEFNFLNYLAGEIHLQKGDYELAETYFSEFIKNTKGRNFTKDAQYKLFLAYWLNDKESKAIAAHLKAQQTGQTKVEADKHASKSLGQPQFPNKTIMKIRLLTDGGFYEAAKTLAAKDYTFSSKKDKVEFTYRKARLLHKTGDTEDAIKLYAATINETSGETWYFAPNSCLQLGYIYHQMGDISLAKHYFNEVLGYKNHEYKASLDNKAKAALAGYEEQ